MGAGDGDASMTNVDIKDLVGGALMVAIGTFVAVYAASHYSLGSLGRMGPGMFPMIVGWILAGLGVAILVPALFRSGQAMEAIEWRPALAVFVACIVFAITLERFGIVPATAALTLISTFADAKRKMSPLVTAIFVAAVSVVIALIFKVGLDIPVAIARWPF